MSWAFSDVQYFCLLYLMIIGIYLIYSYYLKYIKIWSLMLARSEAPSLLE